MRVSVSVSLMLGKRRSLPVSVSLSRSPWLGLTFFHNIDPNKKQIQIKTSPLIVRFENKAHRIQSAVPSLWMVLGLRYFGLVIELVHDLRGIVSDSAASGDKATLDFLFRSFAMAFDLRIVTL